MRADMNKVLVESPRVGRASAHVLAGSGRHARHRLDPDGEGGMSHLGMRRDAIDRKHFGEHLAPLYRWLDTQVHRPWAKVWGELCAQLDRRNVVQAHLFEHIDDHVDRHVQLRDGALWVQRRWFGVVPLADSGTALFVHPLSGLLLPNRARLIERRRRQDARRAERAAVTVDRIEGRPGMPSDEQWRRIDGLWYAVTLAPLKLDDATATPFDVLLRRTVLPREHAMLHALHGRAGCYAAHKRQLGRRQLKSLGPDATAG